MKVIRNENKYRIINDANGITDFLPAGTYEIEFSPTTGYCLVKKDDLKPNLNKLYGNIKKMSDRIINRYLTLDRSFGTILSGVKGTGKTLLARLISYDLLSNEGISTIIVKENTDGLVDFLNSIKQPTLILFDEFEKNFKYKSKYEGPDINDQYQFLSLFDGLNDVEHFFLLTVNNIDEIDENFLGRTGRFHYVIDHTYLNEEQIKEVMEDRSRNIDKDKLPLISKKLSLYNMTYDKLISLIDEINYHGDLNFALKYLNLELVDSFTRTKYRIKVELSDGSISKNTMWVHPFHTYIEDSFYFDEIEDHVDLKLYINHNKEELTFDLDRSEISGSDYVGKGVYIKNIIATALSTPSKNNSSDVFINGESFTFDSFQNLLS